MPFQKKHKFGFTSDEPLDKDPICFKAKPGVKAKLKCVPGWQQKLREFVEQLIKDHDGG